MFKPQKRINENAVKKDFFGKRKVNSTKFIEIELHPKSINHIEVSELKNIEFPEKDGVLFVNCTKSKSTSDFLFNITPSELIVICSRLNQKSYNELKNKNIIGFGISERVLQNNPEFYQEVSSNFKIKLNKNHCKITAFILGQNYIVIEGSGNPSINARNETYIISNSEMKYNEIKTFFENA